QREGRHLLGGDGQILGGHRQVFLFLAVEELNRARVEGGQPAASEVVVHLHAHGGDRGGGGGGLLGPQRENARVVGFALGVPGRVRVDLGEKFGHLVGAHARLARAIGAAADAIQDSA